MAPVDRSALYYGKVLANLLFTGATAAVILLLMVVFFNLNLFQPLIVAGVGLGILGYVAVGTVFAALTANARARESMLPILLLPIMMPIFVAGVGLTASVVDGKGFADVQAWLGILVAYDLIFLLVAFLVFDLIWEDS
jgi:heme exporter protein B